MEIKYKVQKSEGYVLTKEIKYHYNSVGDLARNIKSKRISPEDIRKIKIIGLRKEEAKKLEGLLKSREK